MIFFFHPRVIDFIYIFYNGKSCTNLRWSSVLKQMFIIPIRELDEITNVISGVVMPRCSTNDEAELQEQPRGDDIDEEERDDPPDWEKWK